MKLAACCMTKNEERDIGEWALFHVWSGFDTVIIFDNDSQDRTKENIKRIQHLADIRLIDWPYPYPAAHKKAFDKAIEDSRAEFDWLALCDHDEYFIPIAHDSVRHYLAAMERHASIAINWALFGSSGYIDFPDQLTMEAFIKRPALNYSANRHVKSFVRPGEAVRAYNSHSMDMKPGVETVNSKGEPVTWLKRGKLAEAVGLEDTARFHHYFGRSEAHWARRMELSFNAEYRRDFRYDMYDRDNVTDTIAIEKFAPVLRRITDARNEYRLT